MIYALVYGDSPDKELYTPIKLLFDVELKDSPLTPIPLEISTSWLLQVHAESDYTLFIPVTGKSDINDSMLELLDGKFIDIRIVIALVILPNGIDDPKNYIQTMCKLLI